MKAETLTLRQLLQGDRRYVVPVYQRPYVWERERQWEPLWADVDSTAVRLAEARHGADGGLGGADAGAAPHFLGAIVLEQSPHQIQELETRVVVDGQQRLTTIQLMLRGVLDALQDADARSQDQASLRKTLLNDEEVVPADSLLKVVPRRVEQEAFAAAMSETRPDPELSGFAAARAFFAESAAAFIAEDRIPADLSEGESPAQARARLLTAALLGLIKLVAINLEDIDDAQVIFEALNARNTPLSATDLVKNLLFMRAVREKQDAEKLYQELWSRFDRDADWWLGSVGVGHAQRARQDWLLGDWLIVERRKGINIGRLYSEFRRWLDESGASAAQAFATLKDFADAYERLTGRLDGASPEECRTFQVLEGLGITTATPLLLWLMVQPRTRLASTQRVRAFRAVESFVVRRMAAKAQTRAYLQVFTEVLRACTKPDADPSRAVIGALQASPYGYEWPTLEQLRQSFRDARYYGPGGINQSRLRLLLGGMDAVLQDRDTKAESIRIDYDSLTVEHVLPQDWRTHWPVQAQDEASRVLAEQERDAHLHRIGNLTLITGQLNASQGNGPWPEKREALRRHSQLRLNAELVTKEAWNEADVRARGEQLADLLEAAWPGPTDGSWTS